MCDVITIGSATMDVFVESDDANIVSVYTKNKKSEFMSYPYGAKVEISDFDSQVGGGGVNTAVNFANLGFKTSAIFKIGDDIYSEGILTSFKEKNVDLSNIVVMNKEEASMATQIQVRPDTRDEKFSEKLIHPDIKEMFKKLKIRDYQIIVITDGGNGAYAYDGEHYYYCPCFEGPVVSTLGAGDAFASTFCGALGRTDKNIGKALMYASVNSSGVVSEFGATQGLLTFEQIEEKLNENPNYKYVVAE